ncbi:MAG TPA: MAPEG family protein [Polyangiaceae bacterium]|nr:MAPEG family protein [Polyangiaceae bacterium]
MTLPLWTLLVAGFLPYVWAAVGAMYRKREFGRIDNAHPRAQQAQQTGAGARANAASANAFEVLGVYAPAVLVAHLLAPASPLSAGLALGWVVFRVAHGLFYVGNQASARSVCFGLANLCMVLLYLVAAHVI